MKACSRRDHSDGVGSARLVIGRGSASDATVVGDLIRPTRPLVTPSQRVFSTLHGLENDFENAYAWPK